MVLADQGDVAPHGQVRDQGNLRGNQPQMRSVFRQKCIQRCLQCIFAIEESQMNLTIDDSTSMVMMAMKTLTMPFRTAMGMLVSSLEALKPTRIGIRQLIVSSLWTILFIVFWR